MNLPTAFALLGFIGWALFLLLLMEVMRTKLVVVGRVAATEFSPDNANLSPFMQRLARAHANCIEGLPIFGGLMLVAIATSNTSVTDSLAVVFLLARILQSSVHLLSVSQAAVMLRFCAFAVQLIIAVYWFYKLVLAL